MVEMMSKVLIPSDDSEGKVVAAHFGRAQYFAIFNLNDNGSISAKTVHANTSEHAGGRGHAHDNVLRYQPNVIIVSGMGPRGIRSFESQNIAVLRANSHAVDDVIASFVKRELEELTEGCADAQHK